MDREFVELISQKPLVPVVMVGRIERSVVEALLWGLEEEGIPALETSLATGNIQQHTWEIARQSRLNVAIGAGHGEQQVILHHRDLPTAEPLFTELLGGQDMLIYRRLGANAARLIKGNPLVFPEDDVDVEPQVQKQEQTPAAPRRIEPTEELVTRIIMEIVRQVLAARK
ncbi:glycerol dehydratase reactivase beta/small subunit family protein [Desulfogranum japonicum]|uniref:glycerol dehydratase reactivase beta/small subunit family protein n=1 Tax=Desulfogranum japonicum TaxID=231447 RepID=UPI0004105CB7|nr:glycerol dehydratase reactivase beta/small subunit family protein [Desulfogranum japonicum]